MKWATGDLPEACRVFLNTQLKKDPTTKMFDDDEWIRSLQITADIPEEQVTCCAGRHLTRPARGPQKVRPIQMGDFVRKYVSSQLVALSQEEIAV